MRFELTKEFLDELRSKIVEQDVLWIREHILDLHFADIAEILDELSNDEAKYVYFQLEEDVQADVLMELDEDVRDRFLASLSTKEIADQLENLDSDDAADILGDLTDAQIQEVISHMEDDEAAEDIVDLLNYDDDTAGGLMQKEFFQAHVSWPVNRAIIELRKQAEDVEKVYNIFVVDEQDRLLGVLSLKRLLFANAKTKIADIYQSKKIISVKASDSAEVVAMVMEKYDLVVVPVVDDIGRLLGRITIDDIVDVMREEAEKDYQMASGISGSVEARSSIFRLTRARLPWLVIALFGGLAGIIALSTKQKGNVIPGVAIATALMPPLCTAGYGIATGQFDFFFGAIYLFTINTVFIALSSVVVSQLLKFPIRTDIVEKQKRKINQWISLVIVLIIVPSLYFGYNLVQKEKFNENAKRYIENISIYEGNYLLHNEINPAKKQIRLVYGGTNLSKNQKEKIKNSAENFELNGATITVEQGLSFGQTSELDKLKAEMNAISTILISKDKEIDRYESIRKTGENLLNELRAFYPNSIESCSYAETNMYKASEVKNVNIVILGLKRKLSIEDENKIKHWIQKRLHTSNVHVLFEHTKPAEPETEAVEQ